MPLPRASFARAREAVERYFTQEEGRAEEDRAEFERYGNVIAELERRLLDAVGVEQSDAKLTYLNSEILKLINRLRMTNEAVASEMLREEKRAVDSALLLGGGGLLAAVGAAAPDMREILRRREDSAQ